jgi:hypothetical protein
MRRTRQDTMLAAVALMGLLLAFAGCGAAKTSYSTPSAAVVIQDARVNGQYNLLLTSTNGRGTTNIYTDFTQTGTTFTGAANTLVCPSNDLSKCFGNDAPVNSITPSGTVSGTNVTMTISFPNMAGADTVTMVGSSTGTSLAGTYTDILGDAGTWTAFSVISLNGSFSGTFNSTPNPLPVAPTISITLAQDASFNLTGKATIMNSPCISSLSLSGQAIGDAFTLTDVASEALLTALPTGNSFTFSYKFEPTAPNCAGDFGRGVVTNQDPWGY